MGGGPIIMGGGPIIMGGGPIIMGGGPIIIEGGPIIGGAIIIGCGPPTMDMFCLPGVVIMDMPVTFKSLEAILVDI